MIWYILYVRTHLNITDVDLCLSVCLITCREHHKNLPFIFCSDTQDKTSTTSDRTPNQDETNDSSPRAEDEEADDDTYTILGQNLPSYIPSSGTEGVTNIILKSTNSGVIQYINILIDLEHTCTKDLFATLTSSSGTSITIFDLRSMPVGSSNMENTSLDDEANTNTSQDSSPFSGSSRPLVPLSAFNGETANGDWLLKITDDTVGDSGRIFTLSIERTLE